MALNVLIRGQSNALLFVQNGGAAALESKLEAATGRDVNVIASWDDPAGNNTVNSGSAFMDWDTDGKEAGLRRVLEALPADVKDNPTLTVWMHNEYDQKDPSLTEAAWEGEVRDAIEGERAALGQNASTTPVEFVPIRYPYGPNFGAIGDGMAALDADAGFNAGISWAARNAAMDGGPEPGNNSSHMGQADALMIGNALGDELAPTMKTLAANEAEPPVPTTPPTPTPAALSAGTGSDTLVLKLSQDAWQGSAQYTVSVDGEQVGGAFTAAASHAAVQSDTLTLKGDWAAGAHQVEVRFLNDAWGGTAATDRNLYVDSATYNGQAVDGAAQSVMTDTQAGGFGFAEAAAPPPPTTPSVPTPVSLAAGSGPDALVLKVSQDAYQGSAQYTVKVDGQQVGGTFTASALHGSGQPDTLTLKGDWAAGAHQVSVEFLNDAWGGTAASDRNLYVDAAAYDGAAVPGADATLWSTGASAFSFADGAAAAPAPPAGSGTIDWAATGAAVQAHFDATGSWGNLSDYLVFA